jgi:hypothetical protein
MAIKRIVGAITGGAAAVLCVPVIAFAATATVVTPGNLQGWDTADTRPGGNVSFVEDATAPLGSGALELTTDATTAAKAQLLKATNTPLAEVKDLSYYTKQVTATSPTGAPSYQLAVDLDANGTFDTNLVYEPYWNGTVVPGTWQQWDVDAGQFWSSSTAGGLTAGAGGPPLYTLADVLALNPDAVVVGFGVNVGTYNPGYNVETDAVVFSDATYDFEATEPLTSPATKEECKDGGWQTFNPAFRNQGECVSFVASNGQARSHQDSGNSVVNFLRELF